MAISRAQTGKQIKNHRPPTQLWAQNYAWFLGNISAVFGLDAPDLFVIRLDRTDRGPTRQQGRHPVPQIRRNLRV